MNHVGEVIRNVFGVEKVAINSSSNVVTLRATMPTIRALNRTLQDLLDGEDEVLLDVKMFSFAKTKTTNIGLQPPQTFSVFNVPSQVDELISQNESLVQQIVSSGLANAGDTVAIAAILIASGQVTSSVLSEPFALFGGGLTESGVTFSGVTANLSLNSSDTRLLDSMQLRLKDQQEGTLKVGTRYPIATSTYSSLSATTTTIPGLTSTGLSSELAGLGISTSSLAAQTIPQIEYQDIGLTLNLTPVVQRSNDVALKVDLKLTALQGTSINGLPVLNNTSFTADVSVLKGASAMLVSDLTREESKALSGLPGLSDLPGFNAATDTDTTFDLGDMVIVITPTVIRRRLQENLGPYIPLPRT
jgi:general secretion pathway protein D